MNGFRAKRVLITGGAGFMGSDLTDRLLADGFAVTVLDDFSSGRRENLCDASRDGDFRLIEGSVLDRHSLETAIEGCTRVYHLTVQCVRRSLGTPIDNHEINATGTLMTLDAARRATLERFIYSSSSDSYDNCADEWLNEEKPQCAPWTVYGPAKPPGQSYTQ